MKRPLLASKISEKMQFFKILSGMWFWIFELDFVLSCTSLYLNEYKVCCSGLLVSQNNFIMESQLLAKFKWYTDKKFGKKIVYLRLVVIVKILQPVLYFV